MKNQILSMSNKRINTNLLIFISIFISVVVFTKQVDAKEFVIFHTNDIHSEFIPSKAMCSTCYIGKFASAVKALKSRYPDSILMDAGDYSEGNAYFSVDLGETSRRMFEDLGYDYITIGNHDWLLGPDFLFSSLKNRKFKTLISNLDISKYPNQELAKKAFSKYDIIVKNGLRIAIIGTTAYEFQFDAFFSPVIINEPVQAVRKTISEIGDKADVFVVLAHNGLAHAKAIAKLTKADLVIAAHDHELVKEPIKVSGPYKSAYIVEAGAHTHYIGMLGIDFDENKKAIRKIDYKLLDTTSVQNIDLQYDQIAKDLINKTKTKYGNNIYSDNVAFSQIDIPVTGKGKLVVRSQSKDDCGESLVTNLATDAFKGFLKTDFSFDNAGFISRGFVKGSINTIDIINAFPHVYDISKKQTWTLNKIEIKGDAIKSFLTKGYALNALNGNLSFSDNVDVIIDPGLDAVFKPGETVVRSFKIDGKEIDERKYYTAAVSDGMIFALRTYERLTHTKMDFREIVDTNIENWQIIKAYLQSKKMIKESDIKVCRVKMTEKVSR